MTPPALAVQQFGYACLLGASLGLLYGVLRPLRSRCGCVADTLFVACMLGCWVYLGFGICRGDLRLGYAAGLAVGGILWEQSAGRWLRPLYWDIWDMVFSVFSRAYKKILEFFKKYAIFEKFYLHLRKKRLQ